VVAVVAPPPVFFVVVFFGCCLVGASCASAVVGAAACRAFGLWLAPAWSGVWPRAGWPRLGRGRAARALLRRFLCVGSAGTGVVRGCVGGWCHAPLSERVRPCVCRGAAPGGGSSRWRARCLANPPRTMVSGGGCFMIPAAVFCWSWSILLTPLPVFLSFLPRCGLSVLWRSVAMRWMRVQTPLLSALPFVCASHFVWLVCVEHRLGNCPALRLIPFTPHRATVPRARPAPPSTPGIAPRRWLGTRANARAGRPVGCATRGRTRRRPRRAATRRRCRKTRRTKPKKGRTLRMMAACC